MMVRWRRRLGYWVVLVGCLTAAQLASWTSFGQQVENDAYDALLWQHPLPVPPPESAVLAIDEATLVRFGGIRRLRAIVARGLDQLRTATPAAVAIDLILADTGAAEDDALLETAMANTRNLVLACDVTEEQVWEEPLPRFSRHAAALGHIHAQIDRFDGVARQYSLERTAAHRRRWALAVEALRLRHGAQRIAESPEHLQIGPRVIATEERRSTGRSLLVNFGPVRVPHLSVLKLAEHPALAEQLRGKVVFLGFTAQSAARDRLQTPRGQMTGVDIHAEAYETLAHRPILTEVRPWQVLALSVFVAAVVGLLFAYVAGWLAYVGAALLLLATHLLPHLVFPQAVVLPSVPLLATAWLSVVGTAAYQALFVRRQLRRAESEKSRYQQAIHFVTHEMRTPLTAIQGSSELMGRYNLNDEKRKQMASMINAESKRLAKIISTFLDVERLSEGQLELKSNPFSLHSFVQLCADRARPLADRKSISLTVGDLPAVDILGDQELLEYALYNLLTNAAKYSPAETAITVGGRVTQGVLSLSVRDQGIGMEPHEVRRIFQKFYRTTRAEKSGEVGTGIGLSIVEQIVTRHGGKIEVTSTPGQGSSFTIVLPPSCVRPTVMAPDVR